MGLWTFLRGLWPWSPRRRPSLPRDRPLQAPQQPEPLQTPAPEAVTEPERALPESIVPPSEPAIGEHDEAADEDEGWEEEDFEDPDAPDPFISGAQTEAEDADLAARRASARVAALSGEQRIYLSMPAGPGSLAEALEQLATEDLVTAEFVADGEDEPHILYRPVA